ncbi:970_t:CDS:1, partial [Gigaspora margarita]
EDKKIDDLPVLDRKVIQNIKDDENSKIVMFKVGNKSMNATNIANKIVDYPFNSERSVYPNILFRL